MPITPAAELAKLLHFGMSVLNVVFDWKSDWVVDADITAQAEKDT